MTAQKERPGNNPSGGNDQLGKLRAARDKAEVAVRQTRRGRDAFDPSRLGLGARLIVGIAPVPLAARLVPGFGTVVQFEGHLERRDELDRAIADIEGEEFKQHRAARAALLAQTPAPVSKKSDGLNTGNGQGITERAQGRKRGRGRRRERRVIADTQRELAAQTQPQTPVAPETEEVFPFKLVTIKRSGRGSNRYEVVDDPEIAAKELARKKDKVARKDPLIGEAVDAMAKHLMRTAGFSHLVQGEFTHIPAGKKVRQLPPIGIGSQSFDQRTLKPNGIEGNKLDLQRAGNLRIIYIYIPNLKAIAIIEVSNDRYRLI